METPKEVKLASTEYTLNMWRYWISQETAAVNADFGNGQKLNPFVELGKKLIGKSQFTIASIIVMINGIMPAENERKVREYTKICDEELTVFFFIDKLLLFLINNKYFYFSLRTYWVKMEFYFIIVQQHRHPITTYH